MKHGFVRMGVLSAALLAAGPAAAEGMSASEALNDMLQGNQSFQKSEALAKRRAETAQSQAPQAIVLSCSDSRVPPEAVFNRYVGRLFVVRTAGHAIGDYELGSIEYAVEHLHTPLIVVMGHERCGAIKATVEALKAPAGGGDDDDHERHHRADAGGQDDGDPRACAGAHGDDHGGAKKAKKPKKKARKPAHHEPDEEEIPDEDEDDAPRAKPKKAAAHEADDEEEGHAPPPKAKKAAHAEEASHTAPGHDHIGALVASLSPVVKQTLKRDPEDPVDAAVRANAIWVAARLTEESLVLKEAVAGGKLQIVAARYDLDTGAVEVLK